MVSSVRVGLSRSLVGDARNYAPNTRAQLESKCQTHIFIS